MHKLPILTFSVVVALSIMTVFICMSGAVSPRETEYGSGRAVFKHYIFPHVPGAVPGTRH
jgi:hypothetical protein